MLPSLFCFVIAAQNRLKTSMCYLSDRLYSNFLSDFVVILDYPDSWGPKLSVFPYICLALLFATRYFLILNQLYGLLWALSWITWRLLGVEAGLTLPLQKTTPSPTRVPSCFLPFGRFNFPIKAQHLLVFPSGMQKP